jgi:hypothetical protein
MLIYIISRALQLIQSTMNVTINNQCSNIELKSPVYSIKDAIYHGHLPQQVDSKSKMTANFKIGVHRSTLSGILLYHLQRKEDNESSNRFNKYTPTSIQLLVIWELRIDRLYSHAWLIEYEDAFIWNEDKLKRLYGVYDNRCNSDIIFSTRRWLLDDNAKLQIVCETLYKGDFEMNIVISEEKGQLPSQKPLWVDPDR